MDGSGSTGVSPKGSGFGAAGKAPSGKPLITFPAEYCRYIDKGDLDYERIVKKNKKLIEGRDAILSGGIEGLTDDNFEKLEEIAAKIQIPHPEYKRQLSEYGERKADGSRGYEKDQDEFDKYRKKLENFRDAAPPLIGINLSDGLSKNLPHLEDLFFDKKGKKQYGVKVVGKDSDVKKITEGTAFKNACRTLQEKIEGAQNIGEIDNILTRPNTATTNGNEYRVIKNILHEIYRASQYIRDLPITFAIHTLVSELKLVRKQLEEIAPPTSKVTFDNVDETESLRLNYIFSYQNKKKSLEKHKQDYSGHFANSIFQPITVCIAQLDLVRSDAMNIAMKNPSIKPFVSRFDGMMNGKKVSVSEHMGKVMSVNQHRALEIQDRAYFKSKAIWDEIAEIEGQKAEEEGKVAGKDVSKIEQFDKRLTALRAKKHGKAEINMPFGEGKTWLTNESKKAYVAAGIFKEENYIVINLNTSLADFKKLLKIESDEKPAENFTEMTSVNLDEAFFYGEVFEKFFADREVGGQKLSAQADGKIELDYQKTKAKFIERARVDFLRDLRKRGATVNVIGASQSVGYLEAQILRIEHELDLKREGLEAKEVELVSVKANNELFLAAEKSLNDYNDSRAAKEGGKDPESTAPSYAIVKRIITKETPTAIAGVMDNLVAAGLIEEGKKQEIGKIDDISSRIFALNKLTTGLDLKTEKTKLEEELAAAQKEVKDLQQKIKTGEENLEARKEIKSIVKDSREASQGEFDKSEEGKNTEVDVEFKVSNVEEGASISDLMRGNVARLEKGQKAQYIFPNIVISEARLSKTDWPAIATECGADIIIIPVKDANGVLKYCTYPDRGDAVQELHEEQEFLREKDGVLITLIESKKTKVGNDEQNPSVLSIFSKSNCIGGDYGAGVNAGILWQVKHFTNKAETEKMTYANLAQCDGRDRSDPSIPIGKHGVNIVWPEEGGKTPQERREALTEIFTQNTKDDDKIRMEAYLEAKIADTEREGHDLKKARDEKILAELLGREGDDEDVVGEAPVPVPLGTFGRRSSYFARPSTAVAMPRASSVDISVPSPQKASTIRNIRTFIEGAFSSGSRNSTLEIKGRPKPDGGKIDGIDGAAKVVITPQIIRFGANRLEENMVYVGEEDAEEEAELTRVVPAKIKELHFDGVSFKESSKGEKIFDPVKPFGKMEFRNCEFTNVDLTNDSFRNAEFFGCKFVNCTFDGKFERDSLKSLKEVECAVWVGGSQVVADKIGAALKGRPTTAVRSTSKASLASVKSAERTFD